MELVLLRHGATEGNERRAYVGRTDEPLSAAGIEQARRAGSIPDVELTYVSPLARARQTAAICFPNARQVTVPDLREIDFGDFEGRTANQMADDPAYRAWVDGWCEGTCPNGESRSDFVVRTWAAVRRILLAAANAGESRVVIVAHGGTVMTVMSELARAAGEKTDYFSWHVGNCEGYVADVALTGGLIALRGWRKVRGLDQLS